MVRNVVRHAAEHASRTLHSLVPYNNEIGVHLTGDLQYGARRIAR
jgi:hypothetical protein